ncbi:T6SS effector phospholipase Tle3 domain-containing protein [Cupriavidus sp. SIMBA_020]|uniref:T6SS effector phospholipase Tle3 domain-containing protein n=1 Tax=Cupriavidus sp. SIMBA_020 TaxID=3085766 RepID=UPI00397C2C19
MNTTATSPQPAPQPDEGPAGGKPRTATRIVPMQLDAHGQPYWESYLTPESFEVRAEAQIPPHLPGVIIFVHGVNSEGEWYDAAEAALCEGLNQRLNREDIEPNEYRSPQADGKQLPRELTKLGNSPVVRFFWGYRPEDGKESAHRIPLRNIGGFDFWAPECIRSGGPWFWGGGPFQNGTNNLQQLWSNSGFRRHVFGVDMQALNTETERQLQDAPPRTYYAHAAHRLARLIDRIRRHSPDDTVTVCSHSQGTMIAMAATALCETRAPDALMVMNSPFALDDKITDALTCGSERPTERARINTFRNIANRIRQDKRALTDAQIMRLQVGATEDMNFWRPDLANHFGVPERDNHGRLYVYFSPHDRVMGCTALQSIGWQGVSHALLEELGDTVKQRMLARGTPCGDAPGEKKFGSLPPIADPPPGVKPDDFWDGNRGVLGGMMKLWAVPNKNQMVMVNAEAVARPLTAEEMTYFDDPKHLARDWGEFDPDKGKYRDETYPYLASIYQPEAYHDEPDIYHDGRPNHRIETADEMRKRIEQHQPEPTDHSSLPGHAEFMKRVVAYDLPIGFCNAFKDVRFWTQLMQEADWTSLRDAYFITGDLAPPAVPALIDGETVADEVSRAQAERIKRREF